jgi:hypothetical protein
MRIGAIAWDFEFDVLLLMSGLSTDAVPSTGIEAAVVPGITVGWSSSGSANSGRTTPIWPGRWSNRHRKTSGPPERILYDGATAPSFATRVGVVTTWPTSGPRAQRAAGDAPE